MPVFCRGVLPQPKVSVLRRRGLAFIRSSLLQLKLHCPAITIEDARKSDLLAELTDDLSDGVSQDLWLLSLALQRWRIEAAEMKLLRPLAGYTLYDHKTNDSIRHELRITGVLDKIHEYRRNWLSHLQRTPQNRIPLKSYYYRPQGRRTIGRPKMCWREQL